MLLMLKEQTSAFVTLAFEMVFFPSLGDVELCTTNIHALLLGHNRGIMVCDQSLLFFFFLFLTGPPLKIFSFSF